MTQKWPASSSRPTIWEWSHETSRSTLFEAIARMMEAERARRERLEVRHCRGVLTLEPDGELLLVPTFTYLKDERSPPLPAGCRIG